MKPIDTFKSHVRVDHAGQIIADRSLGMFYIPKEEQPEVTELFGIHSLKAFYHACKAQGMPHWQALDLVCGKSY